MSGMRPFFVTAASNGRFFQYAQDNGWDHMEGWHHMMGGWMWFWWLFWIGMFVLLIWWIVTAASGNRAWRGGGENRFGSIGGVETPVDILKRRYALGEITKEEYERMKKDLES